jgi:hypothetical protein
MDMTYDIIDGKRVPPTVFTSDHTLTGEHSGTVRVEGCHLRLVGVLKGTLALTNGATAEITGDQRGTVSVDRGSIVTVTGAIKGTLSVSPGATVIVEEGGRLAGTLSNDGTVVIRGVFGGAKSGNGSLIFEGNGYEKQPEVVDGIHMYRW